VRSTTGPRGSARRRTRGDPALPYARGCGAVIQHGVGAGRLREVLVSHTAVEDLVHRRGGVEVGVAGAECVEQRSKAARLELPRLGVDVVMAHRWLLMDPRRSSGCQCGASRRAARLVPARRRTRTWRACPQPRSAPDAVVTRDALDAQFRRERRRVSPERLDEGDPGAREASPVLWTELRVFAGCACGDAERRTHAEARSSRSAATSRLRNMSSCSAS
jgi:hypothetical protein